MKIVDFGLATARPLVDPAQARDSLQELRGNALTQAGALMGTPLYMSPEQIQGPAVDARTDQYALGCVLYEMLCGSPPFMANALTRLLALHLTAAVPPLRARAPGTPAALEQIVFRMLAKPAEPLSSAEDRCALDGEANAGSKNCA